MRKTLISSLFTLSILFSGPYEVGALVEDFSGEKCFPENGDEWSLYDYLNENNGGNYQVIWLVLFDADNFTSRTEAPLTESLYNLYKEQGLTVIGVGASWERSYSCRAWGEEFGITYPILDDSQLDIRSLFTEGNPPHHVLINYDMRLVYSQSGTVLDANFLTDFQDELTIALDELSMLSTRYNITIPKSPQLNQCYPNPFNPTTTISYNLSKDAYVSLMIYDLKGNQIKQLVHTRQERGLNRSVVWNGLDSQNKPVSGGVYLYRIQIGDYFDTQKMVLLK